MPNYGSASYWDERYSVNETNSFDWYQDFSSLEPYISQYLKVNLVDFEIFIVGCGNSKLGCDIYNKGWVNITNIDISSVVIQQMNDLYVNKEEMEFTVMDARNLEYIPDQCFDVIIDKALLETFLCSDNNLGDVQLYLQEMLRVLKQSGTFLIVSHSPPENRIKLIKSYIDVDIEVQSIPKEDVRGLSEESHQMYHYLYICTKPHA